MRESIFDTLEKSAKIFIEHPTLIVIPFFPAVVSLLSWIGIQSINKGYFTPLHSSFVAVLLHLAVIFSYLLSLSILSIYVYEYYKESSFDSAFGKIYSMALKIGLVCLLLAVVIEIGIRLFVLPGLVVIFFSLFIIPLMIIERFDMMKAVRMSIELSKRYWDIILLYAVILAGLSVAVNIIFSVLEVAGKLISALIIYGYSAAVLLNIYLSLKATFKKDNGYEFTEV